MTEVLSVRRRPPTFRAVRWTGPDDTEDVLAVLGIGGEVKFSPPRVEEAP